MPNTYDHRGRIKYPEAAIIPDALAKRIEDEVVPAEMRVARAEDNEETLERQVKPARIQDAAVLKAVVAADKPTPKVIDAHERAALAAVAHARAVKNAAQKVLADVEHDVVREVRAAMPEIESAAAERATALGAQYRSLLKQLIALRPEYMASLQDWGDVIREVRQQKSDAERRELQAAGSDKRTEVGYVWVPTAGSTTEGVYQDIDDTLRSLLKEDATRHVPRPPRFASPAQREQWEKLVEAGGKTSTAYIPSLSQ